MQRTMPFLLPTQVRPLRYHRRRTKRGFTLLELLIVVAIIGILVGMLLPAVRRVREPARRVECLNNLRQLALAALNYESAHMHFPAAMGGEELAAISDAAESQRISGWVMLLPFIEQQQRFERLSQQQTFDGVTYPPMPDPSLENYPIWQEQIAIFHCPSQGPGEGQFGEVHYAFCVGDRARNMHAPKVLRGIFGGSLQASMDDITDGASNTMLISEIGSVVRPAGGTYAINRSDEILNDPSKLLQLVSGQGYKSGVAVSSLGRGGSWSDGAAGPGMINTILPPRNPSPSCAVGGSIAVDGIYSPGSDHPGGLGVALADGSTQFVSSKIDGGDCSLPTLTDQEMNDGVQRPYGVWGNLGNMADGNVVDPDDL